MDASSLGRALENIEIDDLDFVERDLCFNELASIAILLYGEERTTAEFCLQKLLIISNALSANHGAAAATAIPRDLLRTYAQKINPTHWRAQIVEALSVINARRVLRKLGFKWEVIRLHFFPHITELSLHLHPLLKALYKMCESITPADAGRLILYMDQHHKRPAQDHFRFYDAEILEVFLLDWITRRIISVGDREMNGTDIRVLAECLKLSDMDDVKCILLDTIELTVKDGQAADNRQNENTPYDEVPQSTQQLNGNAQHQEFDESNKTSVPKYKVRYESAGFVLIINEKEFYKETDPDLEHLLPKENLGKRMGTDVDKDKLIETFTSFGYKPVVEENLKHTKILDTIGSYAERSLMYDSFIVCILSHGFKGNVCGSNSIPVSITEIEEKFTTEALKDKPKLLIIQACQTKNANSNEIERKRTNPKQYADILIAMSTRAGFPSVRDKFKGTWFIQALCKVIIDLSPKKHLLDIFTVVNHHVSELKGEKDNEVMLPQIISCLRKEFFLPTRKAD